MLQFFDNSQWYHVKQEKLDDKFLYLILLSPHFGWQKRSLSVFFDHLDSTFAIYHHLPEIRPYK